LIINDNIFNVLPTIEKCSQNLIFSDPPYNLSSKWQVSNDRVVLEGKGQDFMNKWQGLSDKDLETMFEEFYRVLKYGGYCCMWSLSRQHLPFLYYANKAGFEQLQSINSFFISSFPKAMDLSKALDKYYGEERTEKFIREDFYKRSNKNNFETNSVGIQGEKGVYTKPAGELAKKYDGYKSSIVPLKEVSETLLVFRKPFKYKSIIPDIIAKEENNESDIHGVGINIGGGRVNVDRHQERNYDTESASGKTGSVKNIFNVGDIRSDDWLNRGRYPSNLYLIDGFNYTPEQIYNILSNKQFHILENIGMDIEPLQYMTEEKQIEYICNYLDKFEVSKVLDEQSGNLKSGAMDSQTKGQDDETFNTYGKQYVRRVIAEGDEGGCSRILHKCKYELNEFNIFNYTTKVSGFERNAGCDDLIEKDVLGYDFDPEHPYKSGKMNGGNIHQLIYSVTGKLPKPLKNNHPTLKNMNLQYKIMNLFLCPKEDIKDFKILIPFCGVLSEYMSAMALGIPEENITGIEISKEYCEIGEARKAYWTKHNFYFKEDKEKRNELKDKAIKKEDQKKKSFF
jgi:hypothetical protein